MGVMVAVQNGTLPSALRVLLKRRVSARRGGDYNEVISEYILLRPYVSLYRGV